MLRKTLPTLALLALSASFVLPQHSSAQPAKLSAAAIVDKNVAARGGLQRWRGVQTLSWTGTMEAGGNDPRARGLPGMTAQARVALGGTDQQLQLPFRWDMMRGRKSRLEIAFEGQTA